MILVVFGICFASALSTPRTFYGHDLLLHMIDANLERPTAVLWMFERGYYAAFALLVTTCLLFTLFGFCLRSRTFDLSILTFFVFQFGFSITLTRCTPEACLDLSNTKTSSNPQPPFPALNFFFFVFKVRHLSFGFPLKEH